MTEHKQGFCHAPFISFFAFAFFSLCMRNHTRKIKAQKKEEKSNLTQKSLKIIST